MPYVRVGKCVHHQSPDGSVGAKIGCSRTVAKAKEHLKAKYAHAPDAKPSKKGKK
jgi:hypothetical protein